VLIGLVLAVSAAAIAVGRRHALVRLEQTVSDLEDSHAILERYASRVAELSAAAERTRMARDLHDSLGHHLTAVGIQLDKAIAFRDRDPVVADRAVRDARSASALALRDARSSVRALRDAPAGPAPLGPALAELARRLEGDDLEITVEVDDAGRECSTATSHVLFRAAQEALTNVRRHARARRAGVRVSASGDGWTASGPAGG
jgi:signal transduction histidine kinase